MLRNLKFEINFRGTFFHIKLTSAKSVGNLWNRKNEFCKILIFHVTHWLK